MADTRSDLKPAYSAAPGRAENGPLDFSVEPQWNTLTAPLRTTGFEPDATGQPVRRRSNLPSVSTRPESGRREFEMVLRKVDRPPSTSGAEAKQRSVATRSSAPTVPPPPRFLTIGKFAAPGRSQAEPPPSVGKRWSPVPAALKISAAGVAAVCIALALRPPAPKPPTPKPLVASGEGIGDRAWVLSGTTDSSGLSDGRQIQLYLPSLSLADYAMDFRGRIGRKSLGWVFRASDSRNYYAVKIEAVDRGVLPVLTSGGLLLTRFVVIGGAEGPRVTKPLRLTPRVEEIYQVRLEVSGPEFKVTIDGEPVDTWADDQLTRGGVGFLRERGEEAEIQSVSLSFRPSAS